MGGVACGACMSRQNRCSKWIWRGVMRDGAGLRPDFTATSLGWGGPSRWMNTHTHTHNVQHRGPRKDEQGQSPCRRLMRGDRWEETLQTSSIKLTFLGSVCVFLCAHVCFWNDPDTTDTVCTHTYTQAQKYPPCDLHVLPGRQVFRL